MEEVDIDYNKYIDLRYKANMRIKKMKLDEFKVVLENEWMPLSLVGDAVPMWARGIPEDGLDSIYASGNGSMSAPIPYQSASITSDELIGGIDIYRVASDDPVRLNKDWYAVVRSEADPSILLVDGPQKDSEHWLNDIPKRLTDAKILGNNQGE